jgi:hypothetical protein
MRKYSANPSFNSGNLAIDFPVRISPTMEGDRTNIAVTTRNRSNQPMYIPAFLTCSAVSPGPGQNRNNFFAILAPGGGVEPPRAEARRILSSVRTTCQ